jgi:hypothetical protein
MSFGTLLKEILPFAIQAAPLVMNRPQTTPAAGQAYATSQDAIRFAKEFADPNSPLLARYAAEEEQAIQSNFLRNLEDLQKQHRASMATRGRALFDPERGSEMIERALRRGMSEGRVLAREAARDRLKTGYEMARGGAATISGLAEGQRQQQLAEQKRRTEMFGLGADILGKVFDRAPQPQPQYGGTIQSPRVAEGRSISDYFRNNSSIRRDLDYNNPWRTGSYGY